MKRKMTALLLVLMMILPITACKRGEETEATDATETTATETAVVETTEELAPGVGVNIFDDIESIDEMEESVKDDSQKDQESESENTSEKEPVATESKPIENTEATEPAPLAVVTEYERYMAMSGDEQMAFMESFGSVEAFFEWLNAAKAEHEALKPAIPIEDGKIDLSEIVEAVE